MKKLLLVSSLIVALLVQSQTVWLTKTYSVKFTIKHALGSTAEGKFSNLQSDLNFNPNELEKSTIVASVDANTFYTGNNSRDKALKGKDYFNAEKYPKIILKSTKFEKAGMNYIGYFDVTIKGITKNMKIPFTFLQTTNEGKFKATFQLNRLDFGVGSSSMLLGDIATLKILLNVSTK